MSDSRYIWGIEMDISSYKNVIQKARHILEVESKSEADSFRSKQKALFYLVNEVKKIRKKLETCKENEDVLFIQHMLSGFLGQIGIIYVELGEEIEAEHCFIESFESVTDTSDFGSVLCLLQARNVLGYYWAFKSQPLEAKKWLEGAVELYKKYKNSKPAKTERLKKNEAERELETTYIFTLFYLCQVYKSLNEILKSAVYCHETLKRKLLFEPNSKIECAVNSATLSEVFTQRFLFKQARLHLAAASYILNKYQRESNKSQEALKAIEELRQGSADVSLCWAKYGLALLKFSTNDADDEEPKETNEDVENLSFEGLDLSSYENEITCEKVVTFEDARKVFLVSQRHLNKAKEYYSLEDRASDHVRIVQDHSELFNLLSAFEPDLVRKVKMMKKRVTMLEVVLNELNPRYYLDICRQLWFELGELYHNMMQSKLDRLAITKDSKAPKFNALIDGSIRNFNSLLESVKDKKSHELPENLPDNLIRPVLLVHFYLGRLYYKYVTPDPARQIENLKKSFDCVKYFVDVCEKNEKAAEEFKEEVMIGKEIMTLLSIKALCI